jgi:hypothetical protein
MGVEKAQSNKFQYSSQQFRSEESESVAYKAAKIAAITPLIVLPLIGAGNALGDGPISQHLRGLGALVMLFLLLAGFICALIALCHIGKLGRQKLLVRGIFGLLFHGVYLVIIGFAIVKGFARGRAEAVHAREVRAAADDMRQSLRQNFDPQHGITNVDFTKTRAARASLDRAAANARGDEAKILKATAVYIGQMDTAARTLKGANTVMEAAKVLQFTNAPTKEDFAKRRRLVQNYQAASERVRAIVTNSPAFYRAELQRLGMTPTDVDKAVADIQQQSAVQHELLCEVRDTDARVTDAMLEIFDLLERHPDHWRIRLGYPSFTNSVTGSAYKQLLGQIENAGKDQVEAQRKLVSLR